MLDTKVLKIKQMNSLPFDISEVPISWLCGAHEQIRKWCMGLRLEVLSSSRIAFLTDPV